MIFTSLEKMMNKKIILIVVGILVVLWGWITLVKSLMDTAASYVESTAELLPESLSRTTSWSSEVLSWIDVSNLQAGEPTDVIEIILETTGPVAK